MTNTSRKGYQNRRERIVALNVKAEKIWHAAYTRALGWSADPEGEAHKAMSDFLARNGC
jgi:hypothetical protein